MANILRMIFANSRPGCLRHSAGLFQLPFKCFVIPNSTFKSLVHSHIKVSRNDQTTLSFESSFPDIKSRILEGEKLSFPSKFDNLFSNISMRKDASEGELISEFNKLLKIYNRSEHNSKFFEQFKEFLDSDRFKTFCLVLHSKLRELSLPGLIFFSDIYFFQVPASSQLMQELFALILSNLNEYTVAQKLHLYIKFSDNRFAQIKECKDILKACEVYFEKCLIHDLYKFDFKIRALEILKGDALPLNVRKMIAEKYLEYAFSNKYDLKSVAFLFKILSQSDPRAVLKTSFTRLLKKTLHEVRSSSLIVQLSFSYKLMVQEDHSFYDEEICNMFTCPKLQILHTNQRPVEVIRNLCLAGHMCKDFKNEIDLLLQKDVSQIRKSTIILVADVLYRYSAPEILDKEDLEKFLRILLLRKAFEEFNGDELSLWCERITYLGCDTRDLFSEIFQQVNNNKDAVLNTLFSSDNMCVLDLHHLAKVYFSDGYEVLSEKIINELLREELRKLNSYSSDFLNDYFGSKDYFLKGCTTSDKHCLHFVSVFGSDNQPINLSKYAEDAMEPNRFFNIEQIERPPDSKVVVFRILEDKQPIYFFNSPLMSGKAKLYLKLFQNCDFSVVLLPYRFFKLMPDEKREYLKSQIGEALKSQKVS